MGEPAPHSYDDQGRLVPQFEEVDSDIDQDQDHDVDLDAEAVSDPRSSDEEAGREATAEDLLIGPGGVTFYIPGIGNVPLSSLGALGEQFRGAATRAEPPREGGEKPWTKLREFPEPTQDAVLALAECSGDGKTGSFTVLLLGKGGVGKSATVNSLLGERAAVVSSFQATGLGVHMHTRTLPGGFALNLIDTPSLLDQDSVSTSRLEQIGSAIKGVKIDAVLFLDRLDVVDGVTAYFGEDMWDHAVLGLTRATSSAPPLSTDFGEWVVERSLQLQSLIAKARAQYAPRRRRGEAPPLTPAALLENHSECPRNAQGERIVPGDGPWVTDLYAALAQRRDGAGQAWLHDAAAAARAANPDRRRKWLIPLVLAAQVALKLVLDRAMEWDEITGDEDGPFDPLTVRERARELHMRKAQARRASGSRRQVADARALERLTRKLAGTESGATSGAPGPARPDYDSLEDESSDDE